MVEVVSVGFCRKITWDGWFMGRALNSPNLIWLMAPSLWRVNSWSDCPIQNCRSTSDKECCNIFFRVKAGITAWIDFWVCDTLILWTEIILIFYAAMKLPLLLFVGIWEKNPEWVWKKVCKMIYLCLLKGSEISLTKRWVLHS